MYTHPCASQINDGDPCTSPRTDDVRCVHLHLRGEVCFSVVLPRLGDLPVREPPTTWQTVAPWHRTLDDVVWVDHAPLAKDS